MTENEVKNSISNENSGKRKRWVLFAGIVIFLTLISGIIVCSQKHVEFCDEAYTYESANSVWKENVYEKWNSWMSGEDISLYYAATDLNPHFITIMKKLWTDHVPLYFWLIRIASLIAYRSSSPWIGMGLNIFLTVLFQIWLFYAIGKKSNYKLQILPVPVIASLLFFSLPLFYSELNLIRMYLLLSYELMMLLWYMGCFCTEDSKKKETAYILTVSCGLITHYLFLPFYGILAFMVFVFLLFTAREKLLHYIRINLLAVLLSCVMDPYWIWRLFRYNLSARTDSGAEHSIEFGKALYRAVKTLFMEPFGKELSLVPTVLLTVFVFGTAFFLIKNLKNKILLLLFIVADFCYLVIVYLMNGGAGRYHYPALCIWIVLEYMAVTYSLICIFRKTDRKLIWCLPSLAVILLLFALNLRNLTTKEIDSLNPVSAEDVLRESFSDRPWVVYSEEHTWLEECAAYKFMIPSQICFVSPHHMPDTKAEIPEEIMLVTAEESLQEALDHLKRISGKDPGLKGEAVMSGSMGFYPVGF